MNLFNQSKNFIQNLKRPVGVSLVILLMGVLLGLAPLVYSLYTLLNEEERLLAKLGAGFYSSTGELIVILAFTTIIIGSAIYTWLGNNIARYVLLVGITLFFANSAISSVRFAIAYVEYTSVYQGIEEFPWQLTKTIARPLFLIALSWWAFHTKKAKRFYQSDAAHLSKAVIS